jgi:hypothetical protein
MSRRVATRAALPPGFTVSHHHLARRIGLLALLSAALSCSAGGGAGDPANPAAEGNPSVAYRSSVVGPGVPCTTGGMRIDLGVDDDRNGVLDPAEIDQTGYVCDGAPGAPGPTTLFAMIPEAAGARCPAGGLRVDGGVDDDRDGVLDPAEIDASRWVCNGAPGAGGATGPMGRDGAPSLTQAVAEPPGTRCDAGGYLVRSGVDDDRDGVLGASEVDSAEYVCHGTDGASALVRLVPQPAGAACAQGGVRVESGLDQDRDGLLGDAEVTASALVCGTAAPGSGSGTGACLPQCEAQVCGVDGCGGVCGSCTAGTVCDAGACVPGTASTGGVVGRVTSGGAPVPEAVVTVGTVTVVADDGGRYRVEGVPAGLGTVSAAKPFYRTAAHQLRVVGGDTIVGDVTLLEAAELAGRVTDASTGAPVAGVELRAGAVRTYSGLDGTYVLSELLPGAWTVTVTRTGYTPLSVDVRAGALDRTGLDVALVPTGAIAGRVTSTNGAALAGATLIAGGRVARTTATGDYVLGELAPGMVTVQVWFAGHVTQFVPATVASGATTPLDVALAPASTAPATVTGTVTDFETGLPVVGVTIDVGSSQTSTSAGGSYSFSAIAPAAGVRFSARKDGYESVSVQSDVAGGTAMTWDVALKPLHDVYVLVVDADTGEPVRGATVLRQPYAGTYSGTTDASGVCVLRIASGSSTLLTSATEYPQIRMPLRVPASGAPLSVTVALVRQPRVCGLVVDEVDGAPVSGASVELWIPGTMLVASATSAPDGSYCLGYSYPNGLVDVYASMPAYESAAATVTLPSRGVVTADLPLRPIATMP